VGARGIEGVGAVRNPGIMLRQVEGMATLVHEVTWDGVPVASDNPRGCTVVVWRENKGRREYLILHRRAAAPSEFEGDWAWTPPAGSRQPGESRERFASRELLEETGLVLELVPTDLGTEDWLVYFAEEAADASVVLDAEHRPV
jgi:8-oxo-dGTP pyrophosphatase MutT (NUDIX family)